MYVFQRFIYEKQTNNTELDLNLCYRKTNVWSVIQYDLYLRRNLIKVYSLGWTAKEIIKSLYNTATYISKRTHLLSQ